MNELYWITRIGAINNCFTAFLIFASLLLIGLIINYFILANAPYPTKQDLRKLTKTKKWIVKAVICFSISLLGVLFTPTTKEMYLIYGLGDTIDYIKSNDKAKQFCKEHNLDYKNGKYTVNEFIELTKDAYGSKIIKQLRDSM